MFLLSTKIEDITVYGELGNGVFRSSPMLKTITMGTTVSSIGAKAFENCSSLDWIEFKSSIPPTFASSNMFSGASSDWVIYVPDSAVNTYKAVSQLAPYADRILPVSSR